MLMTPNEMNKMVNAIESQVNEAFRQDRKRIDRLEARVAELEKELAGAKKPTRAKAAA